MTYPVRVKNWPTPMQGEKAEAYLRRLYRALCEDSRESLSDMKQAAVVFKDEFEAAGDLLYGTAAKAVDNLAIGNEGYVLVVSGGLPVWAAAPPPGAHTAHDEISLNPKESSSGPEGTIFYCSTDDSVYVGTEA
jgi:hypothetical protein